MIVVYVIFNIITFFQDNYNALHISAMYSREDVVKLLLTKKGVDPFCTGGVSKLKQFNYTQLCVLYFPKIKLRHNVKVFIRTGHSRKPREMAVITSKQKF